MSTVNPTPAAATTPLAAPEPTGPTDARRPAILCTGSTGARMILRHQAAIGPTTVTLDRRRLPADSPPPWEQKPQANHADAFRLAAVLGEDWEAAVFAEASAKSGHQVRIDIATGRIEWRPLPAAGAPPSALAQLANNAVTDRFVATIKATACADCTPQAGEAAEAVAKAALRKLRRPGWPLTAEMVLRLNEGANRVLLPLKTAIAYLNAPVLQEQDNAVCFAAQILRDAIGEMTAAEAVAYSPCVTDLVGKITARGDKVARLLAQASAIETVEASATGAKRLHELSLAQATTSRAIKAAASVAKSLHGLSLTLSKTGYDETALKAIRMAIEIWRPLASLDPEWLTALEDSRHVLRNPAPGATPYVAAVLHELSLAPTTSKAAGLESIQAAIDIRRWLTAAHNAFLPDLAASLDRLAFVFRRSGDTIAECRVSQEAAEIRRRFTR